jgi:8-oxo-dGTP pyrophosphatase MutT (NUDIX family)
LPSNDLVLTYDQALVRLRRALRQPLPGHSAQRWLEPGAGRRWPAGYNPDDARTAAGLLLVFPRNERPHIVLTVRTHFLERHGGQVSLPGGAVDAGETHEEAALREAHEEIGLEPAAVSVVGALTPLDIPVSGFRLHPIVAAAGARPRLSAAAGEVARILEVAVEDLMTAGRVVRRTVVREGQQFERPAFVTEGVEVWGATAMVLAEFLAVLGWRGPQDASF